MEHHYLRLAVTFLCLLVGLRATTYTVAPSGGDYTSFAALDAAVNLAAGDIVRFQAAAAGGSATFDERLTITTSGADGNPITLIARPGDTITVRGINGGTQDYIRVLGLQITQPDVSYNYEAIRLAGCTGWLIQNCYIYDTYGTGVNGAFGTLNPNNIIRGNRFSNIGGTGGGVSSAIVIQMYGDSNLIEYNTVATSLDRVRAFGEGTVVRNNYWGPTDTALYPNTGVYPHHTDGFQSGAPSTPDLTKFLYDRNWDQDNTDSVGGTNSHGFLIQNTDTSNLIEWVMVRFNVIIKPGGSAYQFQNISSIYGYNQTAIKIQDGAASVFRSAITYDAPGAGLGNIGQDWRNNTFSDCPNTVDASGIITTSNRGSGFTSAANHSYNYSGSQGVLPAGASPANLSQVDPQFTDRTVYNFTLQSGSPLRSAGAYATLANGSGASSTTLVVDNAEWLFDGWGIADADYIKIGSGSYVQIASIDYTTDTVTLSEARTWSDNDEVRVLGMEDVGALPYGSASATGTLTVNGSSCTVSTVGSVRKVEFFENGFPVSTDYASPYTYTSSGGTVTAKVYSLYASQTPVSDAVGGSMNITTWNITTLNQL